MINFDKFNSFKKDELIFDALRILKNDTTLQLSERNMIALIEIFIKFFISSKFDVT